MKIELTVGELKELFFNESSTNRIKPSSNISPSEYTWDMVHGKKFVPSEKTLRDFKKMAKKEYKKLLKEKSRKEDKIPSTLGRTQSEKVVKNESSLENEPKKPMPHNEFVKMGKEILNANHKHRPGRPKKVI